MTSYSARPCSMCHLTIMKAKALQWARLQEITPQTNSRISFEEWPFYLDEEALKLLEEFQALTSHSNPEGNPSVTFTQAFKLRLGVLRKKRGLNDHSTSRATSLDEVKPLSGLKLKAAQATIPAPIRRYVWRQATGQCSYVDPKTQIRCTNRHFLQVDHVRERSKGGTHEPVNLRLLCHAHHRFRHSCRRSAMAAPSWQIAQFAGLKSG